MKEEGSTRPGARGEKIKKRGMEQRLTTRTGAKAIANPEELQVEEDTAQKGGYRTQGVKGWKNLKKEPQKLL